LDVGIGWLAQCLSYTSSESTFDFLRGLVSRDLFLECLFDFSKLVLELSNLREGSLKLLHIDSLLAEVRVLLGFIEESAQLHEEFFYIELRFLFGSSVLRNVTLTADQREIVIMPACLTNTNSVSISVGALFASWWLEFLTEFFDVLRSVFIFDVEQNLFLLNCSFTSLLCNRFSFGWLL